MKKSFSIFLLIALLAAVFLPNSSFAGENKSGKLRYNLKLDMTANIIATSGFVITSIAMDHLAPSACRWCDVNSFDKWGRDKLKWSNDGAANKAVYVTGYALAPMVAFGLDALAANHDDRLSDFKVDALLIAQATALSAFTTQLVKIAVGRERPYAHYGSSPSKPKDNISFYSGHTSLAFSLAVASGTVASMRGYEMAPWIWGAGLAVATTTGYLSIASDRHYLTDVIAGAVLGSAFGFGIPYLFHRPKDDGVARVSIMAVPTEQGALVSFNGRW